jgi:hypothetical protein
MLKIKPIMVVLLLVICLTLVNVRSFGQTNMTSAPGLLTDPFLQLPTETSVRVVWFTEFAGAAYGDPNGLEPVVPTISPLLGDDGKPIPYIASNDITIFSIFDTGTGIVSSYRFDTRNPNSEVLKFDEFKLK